MITIQDIRDLRKITNVPDAQRFLAAKNIPVEQWDRYLKLVGLDHKTDNTVTVFVRDPARHWLWALLSLNGCSYRRIAEYYNITHASVYEAIKKLYRKAPVPPVKLRDSCSLERMSGLITAFNLHIDQFPRLDLMEEAGKLSTLGDQLED